MKTELRNNWGFRKKYYVASVSFGKDSVWMLEIILKNLDKYPLDLVIFVNTGFEFEALYMVREQVVRKLNTLGIPYKEIDISEEFEYMMFRYVINTRDGSEKIGYKWCGGQCRWGTTLKLQALEKYYREKLSQYDVYEYVGYAYDESDRYMGNANPRKIYPLVEEKITEGDCLNNCYRTGYFWKEDGVYLYEILDRLSCWCCRNKNLKELKGLYYKVPKYFEKLKKLQECFPDMPMKGEAGSVHELEKRFIREGEVVSMFDIICYPEFVYEGN